MDLGRLVRRTVQHALDAAERDPQDGDGGGVNIAAAVNTDREQRVEIVQNGKRTTYRRTTK